MLSDETSSDSETGRFKCSSGKKEDVSELKERSHRGRRSPDRRHSDSRRRDERFKPSRHTSERSRSSRFSPSSRKRRSRDKSSNRHRRERSYRRKSLDKRRSTDRHSTEKRDSHRRSKDRQSKVSRSKSREKRSSSHSTKPLENKVENVRSQSFKERISRKHDSESDNSLDVKVKRSAVHIPPPIEKKSPVPMVVETHETEESDEKQPPSYYSMPEVEQKVEESSVTDSSDDERIRAKLLNLESKFDKTKKKKRKKKKKRSKSKKDNSVVEVTSTTDIQGNSKSDNAYDIESGTPEVTSTQSKPEKSESSEEGEITNEDSADDDDCKISIDPNDLRHKLNRSTKSTIEVPLKDRLQSNIMCGPALPPHLEKRFISLSPEVEGPALPPHLKSRERFLGPSISSDMRRTLTETDYATITQISSEDDEAIGPLPAGSENKWTGAHERLEERALDIKIRKLDGQTVYVTDVKKREEWMTELPEAKARIIGLEARSFRAKEGPDMSDRSAWTDTPEDKARKAAGLPSRKDDVKEELQLVARTKHISDRDRKHEAAVRKHKKKHKKEESLLEMHQKNLKKKKKKEERDGEKQERRPFSRDADLQVNRFDEAQKKSIIKKAETLNSRFSRGEAKYL